MKKQFTSDRWANRMQCRIFEGAKLDVLQKKVNKWLEAQEYVKVLTSKVTSMNGTIIVTVFYVKVNKFDKDYNAR